jgi:hypothetical protein
MTEWLAFNDPFFTDKEPYCNTVRFITKQDAIALWRRTHPESDMNDEGAVLEFMAVHWAWEATEAASKMLTKSEGG